jgi:hypothetical protein
VKSYFQDDAFFTNAFDDGIIQRRKGNFMEIEDGIDFIDISGNRAGSEPDRRGRTPVSRGPQSLPGVDFSRERDAPSSFQDLASKSEIEEVFNKIKSGEYNEGLIGLDVLSRIKPRLKTERGKAIYEKIESAWASSLKQKMEKLQEERSRGERVGIFGLIQDSLTEDLQENPDNEVEKVLMNARQSIINVMKKRNVYEGITKGIRQRIKDAEGEDVNGESYYLGSMNAVARMNIRNTQAEAMSVEGWDDDYGGIVGAFRDSAYVHMRKALNDAAGGDVDFFTETKETKDKVDRMNALMVWGSPPENMTLKALSYLSSEVKGARRESASRNFRNNQEGPVQVVSADLLPMEKEYEMYQSTERWCTTPYMLDPQSNTYYRYAESETERNLFVFRARLQNGVNFKIGNVHTLKAFDTNEILKRLTNTDVEYLVENQPGVKKALKEYVKIVENSENKLVREVISEKDKKKKRGERNKWTTTEDSVLRVVEPGEENFKTEEIRTQGNKIIKKVTESFTLMDSTSLEQVDVYRRYVQSIIRDSLAGVPEQNRDSVALDAEQTAMNLLKAFNYFESRSAIWEKGNNGKTVRKKGFGLRGTALQKGALVNIGVRHQMHPLDVMIMRGLGEEDDETSIGAFSGWGMKQIRKSLLGAKRFLRGDLPEEYLFSNGFDFNEVELINEENIGRYDWQGYRLQYWKVEKKKDKKDGKVKHKLYVPKCYPETQHGSYMERSGLLNELKREGNEINWNNVREDMSTYLYKATAYTAPVWEMYQKGAGELGDLKIPDFKKEVSDRLGAIGEGKNSLRRRWIFYARNSSLLDENSREPKIKPSISLYDSSVKLFVPKSSIEGKYLSKHELFYPWDKPSLVNRLNKFIRNYE